MTASNIASQPEAKPQPNGLARKVAADNSTPGLLRQLNEQRQSLEQELSTFRTSLLGREACKNLMNDKCRHRANYRLRRSKQS